MYCESEYKQRSILKSTRQKNWLLNPSTRVTFQFQIPKLNGEKRTVVTMAKIDKIDSNKRSGISLFLYTPEVFPDDIATQNIETTENGSKLKSKMKVLEGHEVPEQLMIWIKDLEDKFLKNKILKAPAKLAILRRLVDFEAHIILSTVENGYKNVYAELESVNLLTNCKVREEILRKYITDYQVQVYF